MNDFRPLLIALMLAALPACGDASTPSTGVADSTAADASPPATLRDTLMIEGAREPVTLYRYDNEALPFVTYIPQSDFTAERARSDDGESVHFYARFGGQENRNAYLHFFFPSPARGLDTVGKLQAFLTYPEGLFAERGWKRVDDARGRFCPWAQVEIAFTAQADGSPALGRACVDAHAGAPFYLIAHYPAEYAEGFPARARLLLAHLAWRDTGTGPGD